MKSKPDISPRPTSYHDILPFFPRSSSSEKPGKIWHPVQLAAQNPPKTQTTHPTSPNTTATDPVPPFVNPSMASSRPGRPNIPTGSRNTPMANLQSRTLRTNSENGIDPHPFPDTEHYRKDMINDSEQARNYLENKNLLVPIGAATTLVSLSTSLFHISELAKVPNEVIKAIRSVAWLLGELEEETIALSTRTTINNHLDYLNTETKSLMDDLRTTITEEVDKQIDKFSKVASKTLEDQAKQPTTYRDIASRNAHIPQGTDPRILAREGIRLRQFVLDFPDDAPIRQLNQEEILKIFNETIDKVANTLEKGTGKIRSVYKLANKGYLGEFLHDDGAKWYSSHNHANEFITALGELGEGASIKKRNHPMIAYYVPLNLNTENPTHLSEITETNNLFNEDITKIRWAKPPARRSLNQTCGHLIINFSNPDAANRAKTEGLIICNKRVSVAKYKKEPIRCLKCHGWNHIAAECVQPHDKCGTCGAEGHRTSACTNKEAFHCINCNTDNHTSWSRDCPTFKRKCQEFDTKHPENNLPYYPSAEPWTWSPNPQPPPSSQIRRPALPPPIREKRTTQRLTQRTINFTTQNNSLPQDLFDDDNIDNNNPYTRAFEV